MKPASIYRRLPTRRSLGVRGGFTLVEMLLSITIMAIVMVAVAGATHVSMRTYEANQTDAQLGGAARAILQRIAREIRGASSVTCSLHHLTITPASGPDQIDYILEGGQFHCDRTTGAGTQRYTLLTSTDDVHMTNFLIYISTMTVDEQTVTAMVTVQLHFIANLQPMVVSASACPRQNVSP
ncbi:MAG: prepilin-type N-terminal cleavage/methylation domain-containing protein [Phycisphaerae bacterium]|nr:prepilin-type N-terminal cleavage/methylation domain-containing protein [Phycisphaerae bacterium]